jgi:hypothetical protein
MDRSGKLVIPGRAPGRRSTTEGELSDLILRSPAERSEAGRLEGWRSGAAVVRGRPSRRIASATLTRMRGEDADMISNLETAEQ